jgi:hypothetical protein
VDGVPKGHLLLYLPTKCMSQNHNTTNHNISVSDACFSFRSNSVVVKEYAQLWQTPWEQILR